MSEEWDDLVANSMRTFADIEALGRQLAGSIADEFAAHGRAAPSTPAHRTGDPNRNPQPGNATSLQHATRDLIGWIDTWADLARDAIFALTDMAASAVGAAGRIDTTVRRGEAFVVPFWLHSASGSATRIRPTIDRLQSVDGRSVAAHIEPEFGDVNPESSAAFRIVIDDVDAPAGTYHGVVAADAVPDGLAVTVTISEVAP